MTVAGEPNSLGKPEDGAYGAGNRSQGSLTGLSPSANLVGIWKGTFASAPSHGERVRKLSFAMSWLHQPNQTTRKNEK